MIFFDSCSTVACRVGASQPDCRGHSSSRQLCSLHSPSRCRCSAALLTCSLLAGWGLLLLGADWFVYFVLGRFCCLIVRVLFSDCIHSLVSYSDFCSAIIKVSDCIHSLVSYSDFCLPTVVFCSLFLLMSNCWSGDLIYIHICSIYILKREPIK